MSELMLMCTLILQALAHADIRNVYINAFHYYYVRNVDTNAFHVWNMFFFAHAESVQCSDTRLRVMFALYKTLQTNKQTNLILKNSYLQFY